MKLLIGCVAREAIEALSVCDYNGEEIGVTASYDQCHPVRTSNESPFEQCGYAGLNMSQLRTQCQRRWLQRDHARKAEHMNGLVAARWDGAFIDSDDGWVSSSDMSYQKLCLEVGGGEDPQADWKSRLCRALDNGCKVSAVSMWLGTELKDGNNVVRWKACARAIDEWNSTALAVAPLRMHNADFLSASHYRMLHSLGVNQFNIAPQLGLEVTLAYLRRGVKPWWPDPTGETTPADDIQRLYKWGPSPDYGGHYFLERMDPEVRRHHWGAVVLHVASFLREVLGWIQ